MRDILFRGRCVGGPWLYGSLLKYGDGFCEICVPEGDDELLKFRVDPETVGQFTGLTDKNGKKIFEGDVVTLHGKDLPHWYDEGQKVVVEYDQSGFIPLCEYDSDCGSYVSAEECEVIGNIHDNPELLGGAGDA